MTEQVAPSTGCEDEGLHIGAPAPDFSLDADDGSCITLKAVLANQHVLIYFYPKDNTPGCTTESRDFAARFSQFEQKNVAIFGISKDSLDSHRRFKAKYALPFLLLSDPQAQVCEQFGVYRDKSLFGKHYKGIERSTFLIDQTGTLRAIWRKVKVKGHADTVLQKIDSIL